MTDNLESAVTGGVFGTVCGAAAHWLLKAFFMPVRQHDLTEVKVSVSELEIRINRDFVTKTDLQPMQNDIRHIRDRVDQLTDRMK